MLKLHLTKLSNSHHRFACLRRDGTGEAVELETRNFLLHDLIHFAVESEAGLKNSFYGLLARGETYAALSAADITSGAHPGGAEILLAERIVGAFTPLAEAVATPEQTVAGAQNLLAANGEPLPQWLDVAFAERVAERLRRLQGQWKATVFGGAMELIFDAG